jgi:2-dehydro-3-deoxyglucarate aldolase
LNVKEKLKSGKHSIGAWMQIPSTSVASILGEAGFDWIVLDLEHGSFSLHQLPDLFRAISANGCLPMVRLAQNHPKDIKAALDAGAMGLVAPMIETAEQVSNFLKWSNYPPVGTRGIGYSNANKFGKNFETYFSEINHNLIRIIQIESINALPEMDSMLSFPGIDAMMIGPYDLSGSMNLTGKFQDPKLLEVIKKLEGFSSKYNIPLGTHVIVPDPLRLKEEIKLGRKFIAYSTDALLLQSSINIKFQELI